MYVKQVGPSKDRAGNRLLSAFTCYLGAGVNISSLPGAERELDAVCPISQGRISGPCLFIMRYLV